jgi:dipeptidyl aminopeptidase/acylaminoacyl peptidase
MPPFTLIRSLTLVWFAVLCPTPMAAAAHEPDPAPAHSGPYMAEALFGSTQLRGVAFSGDGQRLLFSSNRSGAWNVYWMPVAGGSWTAVTRSTSDNSHALEYFPNDDRVLVTRDRAGDEQFHVYVIEGPDRERDLTPGAGHTAEFLGFSGDGRHFYIASNERDPAQFDLYRYDSGSYSRTLIYRNTDGRLYASPGDSGSARPVSRDGRWLTLHTVNNANDFDLDVVDLLSGRVVRVAGSDPGDARVQAQDFSFQSDKLYYTANDKGDFAELRRFDLAEGTHEHVRGGQWDVTESRFSPGGRYRVDTTDEDASAVLTIFDAATGKEIPLPRLPSGEIREVRFSRSEDKIAFYVNGDRQPNDLHVLELGGAPRALTRSLNPAIDPKNLVDSRIVRFTSFDGTPIPNVLWKPHQASRSSKAPALVWVHGGPGGQTTRAYNPLIQLLVSHGYVVLGVNNRGSSGYGKRFLAADDGKHGREPLLDVVSAKRYLASLDYVDADNIGVIGQSYGGYMVVAALAFHPDEFQAGVDLFGVTNWLRTIESIPPHLGFLRKAAELEFGHPVADRDKLIAISPLFHADRISKPMLVLQGANDPRTLKVESDEIVAAVRKNGVPVEYVVFPDEGHGFAKPRNQLEGYGRVLAFLDRYLKRAGTNGSACDGMRPCRQPDQDGATAGEGR